MSAGVAHLLILIVFIGVLDLITLLLRIRRNAPAWDLSWTVAAGIWALFLLITEYP